jgi:hypothetical protein
VAAAWFGLTEGVRDEEGLAYLRAGREAGVNAPVAPLRQEASSSLLDGLVAEAMRSSGGVTASAIRVLTDQGMPWTEIGSILGSDGPELVRRTLELHRERLEERLAEQRAELDRIEPLLLEALVGARSFADATGEPGGEEAG